MPEPIIKCAYCGNEYQKRTLRCNHCNHIGVNKLYKYAKFNEYSLKVLINKWIWYPAAKSLNDPFEFSFTLTESSVYGMHIDDESLQEAENEMKSMGVLSLSESCTNILMWAHYSDNYSGFCIGFDRNDDSGNILGQYSNCIPVNYVKQIPKYQPIELMDKTKVANILTTKSDQWEYEKEWRLLTAHGNEENILPGPITEIIFGERLSESDRRSIKNILKNSVKYYFAVRTNDQYSIKIVEDE